MTMPMRENITFQGGQILQDGSSVGSVGPAGFVRDRHGCIIGTVGLDGSIKDSQGHALGALTGSGLNYDFSPNPLAPDPFAEPGHELLPGVGDPNPLTGLQ